MPRVTFIAAVTISLPRFFPFLRFSILLTMRLNVRFTLKLWKRERLSLQRGAKRPRNLKQTLPTWWASELITQVLISKKQSRLPSFISRNCIAQTSTTGKPSRTASATTSQARRAIPRRKSMSRKCSVSVVGRILCLTSGALLVSISSTATNTAKRARKTVGKPKAANTTRRARKPLSALSQARLILRKRTRH